MFFKKKPKPAPKPKPVKQYEIVGLLTRTKIADNEDHARILCRIGHVSILNGEDLKEGDIVKSEDTIAVGKIQIFMIN